MLELRHHPADHDLQADHRGDRGEHALQRALALVAPGAGHQPVHEGEEGEVAPALGELRHQIIGADQGQEDRPDRHGGEGGEQGPVALIAIPAAQLEHRQRPVERGGDDMAPEDEEAGHRTPAASGQSTTRAVWRRIRTSRKGE